MLGHAQLGDARRTARLVRTFDQMCRHPGGTLPDKISSPADLKALYRLCDCEQVTHAALIAALRAYTLLRIAQQAGPVLVLHDATELDYSSLASLMEHLGQIGEGHGRGYICHNVLAVAADTGEVLGLLDQILHCRDEVPEEETLAEHRDRETRESLLWINGTAHLPDTQQMIDVADQGAGTFEFLEHELKSGRRFVIRDGKVRKVYAGHQRQGRQQYLRQSAENLPELGRFTMDVQAQKGRKARSEAEFVLRGGAVLVLPPHAKHGHHGNDPLPLYLVCVREVHPPRGEKRIEWMLLTNEPVLTGEDAQRVAGWYERRWIVEEYHKGMKTGCQIEDLQFEAVERLQPAIALLSAVALTLLNLRDASRRPDAHTRHATAVVAAEYVEVLSLWRHNKVRPHWTIHDFFFALARLGGHQNRKRDHRPGWLVLWRGWSKLQLMLNGYLAAQHKKCG
ncbi:MAG: IS4 family transposase [Acidobacteria bacterium]|nr:IS4 family transposase [Acidobacteriota bacterium]